MKTFRKVFKSLILILTAAVCLGGWYAYELWSRSDELLRQGLLTEIAKAAPGWDVRIARCRFDFMRRIHVNDLHVHVEGSAAPITTFPQTVISIDRGALADEQRIAVQKVRLIRPQIELVRDGRGRWNWQGLPPIINSGRSLPEFQFEQGTIRIRLEDSRGNTQASVMFDDINLMLIPSGKRHFAVEGALNIETAGQVNIKGRWNVDEGTGTLSGGLQELAVGDNLLQLAASVSPQIGETIARFNAKINAATSPGGQPSNEPEFALASQQRRDQPFRVVTAGVTTVGQSHLAIPGLGITASVNVEFKLSRLDKSTPPKFQVALDILRGEIANPILPYRLYDLNGKIYCNNEAVQFVDLRAANGMTQLGLNGKVLIQAGAMPAFIEVDAKNIACDEQMRARLPAQWTRLYDMYQPTGHVDVTASLFFDGTGQFSYENLLLTARRCGVVYQKFPYPVEAITGTIKQRARHQNGETVLDLNLQGIAGRRPVILTGFVKNPGLNAEAIVDLDIDALPIDEALLAAATPTVRKTINDLSLTGTIDVDAQFLRPPGPHQKYQLRMIGNVKNAAMNYGHFPYRITNVAGTIAVVGDTWRFSNLTGRHGSAQITGHGTFTKAFPAGNLDLVIEAKQADVDETLRSALPNSLKQIWTEFSPSGRLDLTARIQKQGVAPVNITLPKISLTNGKMLMESLPYPVRGVEAEFTYGNGDLAIHSLTGRHAETQFSVRHGQGRFETDATRSWKVRIESFAIDDLQPDQEFRRALPEGMRCVFDCLDPNQTVSIVGMVELRGNGQPGVPVTAAWDIETTFDGGTLSLGLDCKNVHGRTMAWGTWDGSNTSMNGEIDLETATILGYHLKSIKGPFTVNGLELTVGSPNAFQPAEERNTNASNEKQTHVTAEAIGGVISLDAKALMEEEPSYQVRLNMSHARLEQYAREYMSGQTDLLGIMNGWVDLRGRGNSPNQIAGRGQLQISPAALYELPIMVQIFKVLSFVPPDKTAFRYALLEFDVQEEQFRFHNIDLDGNAIRLRGLGTAGFDGRLKLDFYSMLPRSQFTFAVPIKIFNNIVGEATKGWVGIEVRGNINNPAARIKPAPNFDDAVKRFLKSLEMRPQAAQPRSSRQPR